MSFFRNYLKKRKGFTLVECLIALAVFAALTLVVFAILANARQRLVIANATEENLNILIDNVVSDETYVSYNDPSSKELKLNVTGGGEFKVSYSVIDGYKNFVLCTNTSCEYFAENTEFMTVVPEDFDQTYYLCPKCSEIIDQTLYCEDCQNEGSHIASSNKFTYIPTTSGYSCNDCGGMNVKGKEIQEGVVSSDSLGIKGMVPNAILYGEIEPYENPEDLFDLNLFIDNEGKPVLNMTNEAQRKPVTGEVSYSLEYRESATNSNAPGVYTLTVTPDVDDTDVSIHLTEVIVKLPEQYNVSWYNEMNATCIADNISNTLSFIVSNNGIAKVEFSLTNKANTRPFELDYSSVAGKNDGLINKWFLNETVQEKTDATGKKVPYVQNVSITIS